MSILYLGYEISENTETQSLATHLRLSDQIDAVMATVVADPGVADVVRRGDEEPGSLTESELYLYANTWYPAVVTRRSLAAPDKQRCCLWPAVELMQTVVTLSRIDEGVEEWQLRFSMN